MDKFPKDIKGSGFSSPSVFSGATSSGEAKPKPKFLSAIIGGVSSLLSSRSARKAEERQRKADEAARLQQRAWDVEDRDMARRNELEDRTARQALLNPYAEFYKGDRRAPVASQPEPVQPAQQGQSGGGMRNPYEDQYRVMVR